MHSPNGKKDGLQIIPVSEVAAKDEFANIKGVTRDDMLAALRVPPQLLGMVPQNSGGFGLQGRRAHPQSVCRLRQHAGGRGSRRLQLDGN